MTEKPVMIPGSDHPITVEPTPGKVVVTFAGHVIADTASALTLRESTYPAVQYIPRDDQTYCPFKGDAGYFSIRVGDSRAENAVWTYEAPYDAVSQIKDHVAFYPDRVVIEETPAG
jgi:uncharacterized protein (DUF427 family)